MTVAELGELRREFKPGPDNLIAGIIIGLLMIAGGGAIVFFLCRRIIQMRGALPLWSDGECWVMLVLGVLLGLLLASGGVFMIYLMRVSAPLRIQVRQRGLAKLLRNSAEAIPWENIVAVEETYLYERPPILKGPAKYALPEILNRCFAIATSDGEVLRFNASTVLKHLLLAEMIKAETDARNIPWAIVEEHASYF